MIRYVSVQNSKQRTLLAFICNCHVKTSYGDSNTCAAHVHLNMMFFFHFLWSKSIHKVLISLKLLLKTLAQDAMPWDWTWNHVIQKNTSYFSTISTSNFDLISMLNSLITQGYNCSQLQAFKICNKKPTF